MVSSHDSALESFKEALRKAKRALRPPPTIDLPEWADTYRHLSSSSGAFAGQWKTSRVECARGPMMAVTEPGVGTITCMTCTQLLKTSLLENVIGFYAHLDPCPMLLTQPKDGAVSSFSKERITPMVKVTPVLREIMQESRTRVSDDTLIFKRFPGGFLAMASAGSPTNLAMRAIRVTLLDEIDKYETTKEGDPVLLAEERTSTFRSNSLKIRTCSPTLEDTSRIYHSFLEGDQRLPYVACPHCDHLQHLKFFSHVQWHTDEHHIHYPETAAIYCEKCGEPWTEQQRLTIATTEGSIKYMQTRPFVHCDIKQDPAKERLWCWDEERKVGYAYCKVCGELAVSNAHASFTVSKLYSPFTSVVEIAEKWIRCKSDVEQKQTFYNTVLGAPFKAQISKNLNISALISRCELYQAEVPRGGVVLTAGIDVQSSGRFEVEVTAWGREEESWSVDYKVITGDLDTSAPWNALDEYLKRGWKHELGMPMYIMSACIDSGGHNVQAVYVFAQQRASRNIWAIKGASDKGNQWSPIWPLAKIEKWRPHGTKPIIIGANSAKEAVRSKLAIEEIGPGYCHFPLGRAENWFEQLLSERLVVERRGAELVRMWRLPAGRANEALDCRGYAYAALHGLYNVRQFDLDRQVAMFLTYEASKGKKHEAEAPATKVHQNKWIDE